MRGVALHLQALEAVTRIARGEFVGPALTGEGAQITGLRSGRQHLVIDRIAAPRLTAQLIAEILMRSPCPSLDLWKALNAAVIKTNPDTIKFTIKFTITAGMASSNCAP